jgi:hypothetical protein
MLRLPTLDVSDPWTWLRRVFPVRISHSLDRVPDLPENAAGCSGTSYEPFAWWDAPNCCWRTWQRCLIEDWARFSGPWPRSGMTRSGIAYRLPTLGPGIDGTEFGYLPTPNASSMAKGASRNRYFGSSTYRSNLQEYLRSGPEDPIYPHPRLTEKLMGFPENWTVTETP